MSPWLVLSAMLPWGTAATWQVNSGQIQHYHNNNACGLHNPPRKVTQHNCCLPAAHNPEVTNCLNEVIRGGGVGAAGML